MFHCSNNLMTCHSVTQITDVKNRTSKKCTIFDQFNFAFIIAFLHNVPRIVALKSARHLLSMAHAQLHNCNQLTKHAKKISHRYF